MVWLAERDKIWSGKIPIRAPSRRLTWITAGGRLIRVVIDDHGEPIARLFYGEFLELISGAEATAWRDANPEATHLALAANVQSDAAPRAVAHGALQKGSST